MTRPEHRWCGVTSAVTGMPACFAFLISSTEPAVETCWMWSAAPVSAEIAMSLATMTSSAMRGTPAIPRRDETIPSCM